MAPRRNVPGMKRQRSGASSGPEPIEDLQDLFLTEEGLLRLAAGQLQGRRPPKHVKGALPEKGELPNNRQPARLRKALASKLQMELNARGWTAGELAEYSALSQIDVRALLSGNSSFTADVVKILASTFATSEEFWSTSDTN